MKKIGLVTVGFITLFVFACNSGNNSNTENNDVDSVAVEKTVNDVKTDSTETKTDEAAKTNELGKEYTAKYICPNHCKGSGSDTEGECPVCGMELMENPNYQGN